MANTTRSSSQKEKSVLEKLKDAGLTQEQIRGLGRYKIAMEKQKRSESSIPRDAVGRRLGINGGRGNRNYRSNADTKRKREGNISYGASKFVDSFSRNNPRSLPNQAASGADTLVRAVGNLGKNKKRSKQSRKDWIAAQQRYRRGNR